MTRSKYLNKRTVEVLKLLESVKYVRKTFSELQAFQVMDVFGIYLSDKWGFIVTAASLARYVGKSLRRGVSQPEMKSNAG